MLRETLLNDKETEYKKLDLRGFKVSNPDGSVPYIKGKKFSETDFSYADFSGCRFEKCRFEKCTFHYTNLTNITEQECEFVDCNFYKGRIKRFFSMIQDIFLFQREGEKMKILNRGDWYDSMTKDEDLRKNASLIFDEFMKQLKDEGLI